MLVLIPLVGIVYPLAQVIPGALTFVVQRRLNRLYGELRRIEGRIAAEGPTAEVAEEFSRFEEKVSQAKVPSWHARTLYTLKQHARLVRERLVQSEPPAVPRPRGGI